MFILDQTLVEAADGFGESFYDVCAMPTDLQLDGNQPKWRIMDTTTDTMYYLKANAYDREYKEYYEVYSEAMCSKIAPWFFGDYVKYDLCWVQALDCWNRVTYRRACISKNFLAPYEEFVPAKCIAAGQTEWLHDILDISAYEDKIVRILTEETRLPGMKGYFWNLMVFGYLVLNTDQHLGNVGFVKDEFGQYRFGPNFDNGRALLGHYSDSELFGHSLGFLNEEIGSSTFSVEWEEELDLIPIEFLERYRGVATRLHSEIAGIVAPYRVELGEQRCDIIVKLVQLRCQLLLGRLSDDTGDTSHMGDLLEEHEVMQSWADSRPLCAAL